MSVFPNNFITDGICFMTLGSKEMKMEERKSFQSHNYESVAVMQKFDA
jgi:hypothetical protein